MMKVSKRNYSKLLTAYPWVPVFEDEDENPPKDPPKDTPPIDTTTLTPEQQAAVEKMVQQARAEESKKAKQALSELEALKSRTDLTKKQREDLEQRYDKIQKELLTKEELYEQEKKKRDKEYQETLDATTSERDLWKNRYVNSTIEREITTEAARREAFDNEPIIAMLRPKTELVEDLDEEGEPTGTFTPKVKFMDPEADDGKGKELILTVPEAVKRMTELERYQYLFKGRGTGGTGKANKGGKPANAADLAKQGAEAYRAARKAGQI